MKRIFFSITIIGLTWLFCYFLDGYYSLKAAPYSDAQKLQIFKDALSASPLGTKLSETQKKEIVKRTREYDFRVAKRQYSRALSFHERPNSNQIRALGYYRKAASHGHVKSHCAIATMYAIGDGVEVNLRKAYHWAYMQPVRKRQCGKKIRKELERKMSKEEIRIAISKISMCDVSEDPYCR